MEVIQGYVLWSFKFHKLYILTVTTAQEGSIYIHASVLLFYQCFLKPSGGKKGLPRDWVNVLVLTQTLWREY